MANRQADHDVTAGRNTKQAILDAALQLFGSKGFEQTSLREVVDAVGITKPSLYYHYGSKLELLVAIIDPVLDHLRTIAAEIETQPRDAQGRREVLRSYIRGLAQHRDAGALLVRDTVAILNATAERHPEVRDTHTVVRDWLAGPDPTAASMLRASAAMEVLAVALISKEVAPDAEPEVVESTLLDAAIAVLEPNPR